ncbi:hypothetical protein PPACK8108_LOCUS7333 [Phakopsora pachyrhizi]|uniref:Proteasome assembly chaperone 3 n=1 Tax=Phakopsora pachyrhizi TaxID=170000 RepID=A0AAV0ATY9_PHAPC|nr:hypothetical protein PPACK8108_LOCUS7333 [Phakopsora pachyrhizi]
MINEERRGGGKKEGEGWSTTLKKSLEAKQKTGLNSDSGPVERILKYKADRRFFEEFQGPRSESLPSSKRTIAMNNEEIVNESESSCPILIKQSAKLIDDVQTEVISYEFDDRTLILITQLGKVGNLIQVSLPLSKLEDSESIDIIPGSDDGLIPRLPSPLNSLDVTPILGSSSTLSDKDDGFRSLLEVYVRQISTIIISGFDPNNLNEEMDHLATLKNRELRRHKPINTVDGVV